LMGRIGQCERESIAVALGDSHRHAHIKGQHTAFTDALKLYRKYTHSDMDDEDSDGNKS
jgi:hypothetical protein